MGSWLANIAGKDKPQNWQSYNILAVLGGVFFEIIELC